MIFNKFRPALKELQKKLIKGLQAMDTRTHGWLSLLAEAASSAFKPESTITAAAIAYFALFSIFPLILFSITIGSYHLIDLVNQEFILNKLEFIAPALGQLLGPNIERIIHARGSITVVALIGLVWSASTVFNMLNQTLSDLWGYQRVRPVWERRGVAILFVLVFAGPVLVMVSLGGSILSIIYKWLPNVGFPIVGAVSIIIALVLNIALFELLYIVFPHRRATWRELLPGAMAAGILWELAKQAFVVFVASYVSAYNLVYGSVAAIIAFLTWSYLSGLILLFGAYFSLGYFNRKHPTSETQQ